MTLRHIATNRLTERDMLTACVRSGQVDSRQIAAHIRASELDGIGNECALPIVVNDLQPVRKPHNWQSIGWQCFWAAFALYMLIAFVGR